MGKVRIEYDSLAEAYDIRCALEGWRYKHALEDIEDWLKSWECRAEEEGASPLVKLSQVRYMFDECVGLLLRSEDFRGLLDPPISSPRAGSNDDSRGDGS